MVRKEDAGYNAPASLEPDDTHLFQLIGPKGEVPSRFEPKLSRDSLLHVYRTMVFQRMIDERMMNLQRQGRIGFYGATTGEEATPIASAAALDPSDWIFPALRQGGTLLYRGYPLKKWLGNLFGTLDDPAKGRSMPCHYSDRDYNVVSWSSCIGTQLPHAVGMSHAAKIRGDKTIAAAYLGDGATSEGDSHISLNWAAVYTLPVVFICQNNQWAISVPTSMQTASETYAIKARAYGMPGYRVDGNDALAVYYATKLAADRARRGEGPTFIEAVTYRMLGHSTSDDPTRYRDSVDVEFWKSRDPIKRLRSYLEWKGLYDAKWEAAEKSQIDAEIDVAIPQGEKAALPALDTMMDDVFEEPSAALKEQLANGSRRV
ncbi:MAG: 3-methyl-2-oxobutanoate dehydrogenase [Euryarchaeota archaeon]|nr:3-methyl-2-oxobutanoate dehydrogenase [Euryarchaeota archaeon]